MNQHEPSPQRAEGRIGNAPGLTRGRASVRLVAGVSALVATDIAGGLLSVYTGVNSWSSAWGNTALLAAPAPMVFGQILLAWLAVRPQRRWAAIPAGMLSATCAVSVASAFFDGALRNDVLSPALFAFQLFLLGLTALVGVLAAQRAREVLRTVERASRASRRRRPTRRSDGAPAA